MSNIRPYQGKFPQIATNAFVDESAVVIGDVEIGSESSIWPLSVVRGDVHMIRIGSRTNIQDSCVLHVTHKSHYNPKGYPLIIGNGITVGHKVILHACEIKDHCLIGMGAIVMDGAVVEPRTILAAGSLVPGGKVIEGNSLWRGSPARRVRALTDKEIESLDYSAGNYVKLSREYL